MKIFVEEIAGQQIKSAEQIRVEQDGFLNAIGVDMSKKDDDLKEAMRSGNFATVLPTKQENASDVNIKNNTGDKMKVAGAKKHVSLRLGVVGAGQAGGRMAEVFYNFGYDSCAINTARQDLEFLTIPEARKLCLQFTLSGTGKDIEIGQAAVEDNRESVRKFIEDSLTETDALVLTLSLGGGSGSGGAVPLVEIMNSLGKPLLVICALPGSFDDSQSKFNAMQTLSRLADLSSRGVINSLMIIDNAKMENTHPNLSQSAFWDVSNRSIIEPLHLFNSVTAMPSSLEVMDSMDYCRALLEAGNSAVLGTVTIPKEEYTGDESSLLVSLVNRLPAALPADDFNLKEAQAVGILVTARQEVLDSLPYASIAYVFKFISEEYDSSRSFKGVYALPGDSDDISISFVFSGLGLPSKRVEELKLDAEKHVAKLESKRKASSENMKISGVKLNGGQADKIMAKVRQQQSAVGKLMNNMNKVDRKR